MSPQDNETVACPLCKMTGVKQLPICSAVLVSSGGRRVREARGLDDAYAYDCPRCGKFVVSRCEQEDFLDNDSKRKQWHPERLSALLREQTLSDRPAYWIRFHKGDYPPLDADQLTPIHVDELLAKWPQTVSERLDRVLCNIARLSPTGGHKVKLDFNDYSALGILFACVGEEGKYHVNALGQLYRLGFSEVEPGILEAWVTPEGWARAEELTRGSSSPENPVFVAMWFGVKENKEPSDMTREEMTGIYAEGIKPAVERAGYRVSRVDLEEFNDSIMDKVFGDIRAAPFVVADFTGHRNGVYLEAGFARGLGRPVIQTCAESHFGKAHFDTRHLNHICWQNKADLQERLYHRIRGTMGLGPYARREADGPPLPSRAEKS